MTIDANLIVGAQIGVGVGVMIGLIVAGLLAWISYKKGFEDGYNARLKTEESRKA